MDILGPFTPGKGQVKFLIVGIDYFTKWIQAKPLATITTHPTIHMENESPYNYSKYCGPTDVPVVCYKRISLQFSIRCGSNDTSQDRGTFLTRTSIRLRQEPTKFMYQPKVTNKTMRKITDQKHGSETNSGEKI